MEIAKNRMCFLYFFHVNTAYTWHKKKYDDSQSWLNDFGVSIPLLRLRLRSEEESFDRKFNSHAVGIEPTTFHMRSENHTPRPSARG